jgi:hypothetical protein
MEIDCMPHPGLDPGCADLQLSRRAALAGIGASALAACGNPWPASAQTGAVFTPEDFGARGDGRSDDYQALRNLAQAVSRAGGGTVRFGRGRHYLIERIQIWGGPNRNDLAHIAFNRCRGLRIDLNGATISVKGDFHRRGDANEGRHSWLNAIMPIQINRCVDVLVENGVLNGNVERMTKDPQVDERGGHGIMVNGSDQVVIQGLHIHHFSGDGIRLGIVSQDENRPCQDVRLNQVRLTNNARQGLTIAGAVGVVATDCEFSQTGRTGGGYAHAPMAGIDLEPNRFPASRSDFRGIRCRFDENRGYALTAASPDRTAFVELIDCGGRAARSNRLALKAERTLVRGGSWHNIQIAAAYAATRRFERSMTIEVAGAQWTGDDPAWAPVYDLSPRQPNVHIHDNRFDLRSPRPLTSNGLFQCSNPNHRFVDNEIFVSRTGHDGSGGHLIGNFRRAALVRGNRWRTDAAAPRRFVNDYRGAARVEGESFEGAFGRVG